MPLTRTKSSDTEDEGGSGSIGETVGGFVGKVAGAISNLVGGSENATEETAADEKAETTSDAPKA
jgi:hypothetical protein